MMKKRVFSLFLALALLLGLLPTPALAEDPEDNVLIEETSDEDIRLFAAGVTPSAIQKSLDAYGTGSQNSFIVHMPKSGASWAEQYSYNGHDLNGKGKEALIKSGNQFVSGGMGNLRSEASGGTSVPGTSDTYNYAAQKGGKAVTLVVRENNPTWRNSNIAYTTFAVSTLVPGETQRTVKYDFQAAAARNSNGAAGYYMEMFYLGERYDKYAVYSKDFVTGDTNTATKISGVKTLKPSGVSNGKRAYWDNKSGGSASYNQTMTFTNNESEPKWVTSYFGYYTGAGRSSSALKSYHHDLQTSVRVSCGSVKDEPLGAAGGGVAKVGSKVYANLADAVKAYNAASNETLTLLQDVTTANPVNFTAGGVIDLGGKTWTASNVILSKGTVTVKNGTLASDDATAALTALMQFEGTALRLEGVKMNAPKRTSSLVVESGDLTIGGGVEFSAKVFHVRVKSSGGVILESAPKFTMNGVSNEAEFYLDGAVIDAQCDMPRSVRVYIPKTAEEVVVAKQTAKSLLFYPSFDCSYRGYLENGTVYFRLRTSATAPTPPAKYTVTLDPNGGKLPSGVSETRTVESLSAYGQSEKLPVLTRSGYAFKGWYTDKTGGTLVDDSTKVTAKQNHTLYARWEKNPVQYVTFDPCGGYLVMDVRSYEDGKYGFLPTPTRDGYSFAGWYTKADGGERVRMGDAITHDTLYAHWGRATVIVMLRANGGKLPGVAAGVGYGVQISDGVYRGLLTPEREGYTFDGWYYGDVKVEDGDPLAVSEPHSLTAKWSIPSYTVTFNANGGTIGGSETKAESFQRGQKLSRPTVTAPSGKVLKGWSKTRNGEDWWNFSADTVDANVTLYAIWEARTYVVTLNARPGALPGNVREKNLGGLATFETLFESNGDLKSDYTPTREHYTFKGWYLNGEPVTRDTAVTPSANAQAANLTAQWELEQHTVTFALNGGALAEGQAKVEVPYGQTIPAQPSVTRTGYKLKGWKLEGETGYWNFSKNTVSEDLTLTADWEAIPTSVTLYADGGKFSDNSRSKKVTFINAETTFEPLFDGSGALKSDYTPQEREGYSFDGWLLNGETVTKDTPLMDMATLTAQWTAKTIQVTFDPNGGALPEDAESPRTYTFGDTYGQLPLPTQEGKNFTGWFTDAANGDKVNEFEAVPWNNGAFTLYAQWKDSHEHDGVNFQEWTSPNSLPSEAGNYYLTQNVRLSASNVWTLPGDVTLCLNGFNINITSEGTDSPQILTGANTFTLYDCQSKGELTANQYIGEGWTYINVGQNGVFNMNGGKITGFTQYAVLVAGVFNMNKGEIYGGKTQNFRYGGAVYVNSTGKFNMTSGVIRDNTMVAGSSINNAVSSGVLVAKGGEFTMTGGVIQGNKASNSSLAAGGVCIDGGAFTLDGGTISGNKTTGDAGAGGVLVYNGTFTMKSGRIIGNSTERKGGGVLVCNGSGTNSTSTTAVSTFTMTGGDISGNTAEDGGGVTVSCSINTAYTNTFTMTGGAISGNHAKKFNSQYAGYGGGVYVGRTDSESSSTYKGKAAFILSGESKIIGNDARTGGGVYTYSGATFEMSGGAITGNKATDRVYGSGGGVYNYVTTCEITGGEISGNTASAAASGGGGVFTTQDITLGGDVVIQGNAKDGAANNLCLRNDYNATVYIRPSVENAFRDGAKVGVTIEPESTTAATGQVTVKDTENISQYLFADHEGYYVGWNATQKYVEISNKPFPAWVSEEHKHCVQGDEDCGDESHQKVFDVALTNDNIKDVYVHGAGETYYCYLTEDITYNGDLDFSGNGSKAYLCLNGHTLTFSGNLHGIQMSGGGIGAFVLCDCQGGGSIVKESTVEAIIDFENRKQYTLELYGGTLTPVDHGLAVSDNHADTVIRLNGAAIQGGIKQKDGGVELNSGGVEWVEKDGGTIKLSKDVHLPNVNPADSQKGVFHLSNGAVFNDAAALKEVTDGPYSVTLEKYPAAGEAVPIVTGWTTGAEADYKDYFTLVESDKYHLEAQDNGDLAVVSGETPPIGGGEDDPPAVAAHKHSPCGELSCKHHPAVEFTAQGGAGELTAGNYCLTGDVTGEITINGTVNLCLNGHTAASVTVASGATLNLCDCQGGGKVTKLTNSGELVMHGGEVTTLETAGTTELSGGVIETVNVTGGEIKLTGANVTGEITLTGEGKINPEVSGGPYKVKADDGAVIIDNWNTETQGDPAGFFEPADTGYVVEVKDGKVVLKKDTGGGGGGGEETKKAVVIILPDGERVEIEPAEGSGVVTKKQIEDAIKDKLPTPVLGKTWDGKTWTSDPDDETKDFELPAEISVDGEVVIYPKYTACEHPNKGDVTETKPANCMEMGQISYTCSDCGLYVSEATGIGEHDLDMSAWKTDADAHWHECKTCGQKVDIEAHTLEAVEDPNNVDGDCEHAGRTKAHCTVCDWEGVKERPAGHVFTNPHNDGDPDTHGFVCVFHPNLTDPDNRREEHTYSWTITTLPTETAEGVSTGTCECGATKTEPVPKLETGGGGDDPGVVPSEALDVTFDLGLPRDIAGLTPPTAPAQKPGDRFSLPGVSGKRLGYDFADWLHVNSDGEETTYKEGGSFTMPAEPVLFTAQWSRQQGGTPVGPNETLVLDDGTVIENKGGGVIEIDRDGDGKPEVVIKLPSGEDTVTVTPTQVPVDTDGDRTDDITVDKEIIDIPGGTVVETHPKNPIDPDKNKDGAEIKVKDPSKVDLDGNVIAGPGTEVKDPGGNKVTITEGEGEVDPSGTIDLPGGGKVTTDDGEEIEIPPRTEDQEPGYVDPNGDNEKDGGEDDGGDEPDSNPEDWKPLEPDGNITAENGTVVTRTPDGSKVEIDKDGDGKPDIVIDIVPPSGEVTVNEKTGEVKVPEGSTVHPGGNKPDIKLPDGGRVDPEDGGVTPPSGGKVEVGEDPGTTITPPIGRDDDENRKVTPDEDGKVDVPGGSTVQTGEDKPEITVPDGGKVDPDTGNIDVPGGGEVTVKPGDGGEEEIIEVPDKGGVITPDGKLEDGGAPDNPEDWVPLNPSGNVSAENGTTVTRTPDGSKVEIDKDGDGKPDIVIDIVPPNGEVTVNEKTGEVKVPEGSTVHPGGNKPDIKLPDGGKVDPEDGGVTPEPGGSVEVGENPGTTITPPSGGDDEDRKVTPGEDGKVDVPGGSTVQTGEDKPEITVPDGGKVDPGTGGIKVPGGSEVTVKPGDGGEEEIIEVPAGGGVITPDGKLEDGGDDPKDWVPLNPSGNVSAENGTTVTRTPDGSKVEIDKDGDGKPDIMIDIVPPNGEVTVNEKTGEVKVPEGSTVHPGGNKPEIKLPDGGKVDPEDGGVTPEPGGSVEVGENPGTTITPPSGGKVTPNGDGTVDVPGGSKVETGDEGPEIKLPGGGKVDPEDGGVTPKPGGSVEVGDKPGTTITPPNGGEVKPDGNGNVDVPSGSTVETGDNGPKITVPGGGKVDPDDGGVTPNPGGGVEVGEKPGTTITPPTGGEVKPDGTGKVEVPDGSKVQTGDDKPEITVPGGSKVDPDTGNIDVPGGGKVTVDPGNGEPTKTIDVPTGGGVITPDGELKDTEPPTGGKEDIGPGGKVTTDDGSTVTRSEDGGTVTIEKPDGSKVEIEVPKDGKVTVDKETGEVEVPEGSKVKPGNGKPEIKLPDGGAVDPDGGVTPPKGGSVEVGGGNGKPGVTVTPPSSGNDSDRKVKPGQDGKVEIPDNSTVKPGKVEDVTITTPNGGKVDPNNGSVTSNNGVTVNDVNVTPPGGAGTLTTDKNGNTPVKPGSSATKGEGDNKVTVTVKDGDAVVDKDGNVTFPNGEGQVEIKKGDGAPTTLDVPKGGSVPTDGGKLSDVEGAVVKRDDYSVVKDATVRLQRGRKLMAEDTTDENGRFTFRNIPHGAYNIVATADGKIKTQLITINADIKDEELIMPSDNVNSILTIEKDETTNGAANVNETVVGGLDDEAEETKASNPDAISVTVTMKVKKERENTADGAERIKEIASGLPYIEFLAITVERSVAKNGAAEEKENVNETNKVLEIVVPFSFLGRSKVTVYRYHDGSAEPLKEEKSKEEGTFYNDEGNNQIHIFARKFSTYAIGYEEHEHSFGPWQSNESSHWQVCDDCGKIEIAPHVYTDRYDTDCNVCGYKRTAAQQPSGGSSGGSGGGSSSSGSAPVITKTGNGTVSVSPQRPAKGDKVTVRLTPNKGYQIKGLTVTDKDGNRVNVTDNGDGTYTFTQPDGRVTIMAEFELMEAGSTGCAKDGTCPIAEFSDASPTAWYHDGVHYCLENGMMRGYGNGEFRPNNNVTRAEVAQILYNREGRPNANAGGAFKDVPKDMWCFSAVTWGQEKGLLKGYNDGGFRPGESITREQLAAIIWRYAGSPAAEGSLSFTDANSIASYAKDAALWAAREGIIGGYNDGSFGPGRSATRAETATILARYINSLK